MSIDAISAALIPQALPTVARAEPSAQATEQFSALMSTTEASPLTAVPAALQSVFAPNPEATVPTLGTQILSGLRGASTDFSDKWQQIRHTLDGMSGQPAVSDVLRLQTQLLQVSVGTEVVGKGISKMTQNIESLVRIS